MDPDKNDSDNYCAPELPSRHQNDSDGLESLDQSSESNENSSSELNELENEDVFYSRGRSRSRSVHEYDCNVAHMLVNQPPSVIPVDPNNLNKLTVSGISPASINPIDSTVNQLNRTGPLHQKEVLALKKGLEEAIHSYGNLQPQEDEEERIAADAEKRNRSGSQIYQLAPTRGNSSNSTGLTSSSEANNGTHSTTGTLSKSNSGSNHSKNITNNTTINLSAPNRIKILMLGDSGVGKSSLVMRWTQDTFSPSLVSTVGVNFKSKKLSVRGEPVQVQVWDTAGQEHFHKITTSYYKGAHGIMLVYDVSDKKSADSVEYWVRNIRSHASDTVQLALIGNKIDLRHSSTPLSPLSNGLSSNPSSSSSQTTTHNNTTTTTTTAAAVAVEEDSPTTPRACVDCDYGKTLSAKYGVAFFETSAKDSSNVNDAYTTLVEQIVDSYLSPPSGPPGMVTRRATTASLLDGRKDKTSKNTNKDMNKNNKDKESHDKTSQITGGTSLPTSSGGLFSSLRRPAEHRRHSSSSSLMNSLKAKTGLPVSISNNNPNTNGQQQPHEDDKEKCCVS